ncbi:MAG: hypothetical protein EHM41_17680 [Chloroflexi bacterium]|nr:MAG: hypothetical protein EHM41_17680 [Chloroflexota bacterium]
MDEIIEILLRSKEPSIRYKTFVNLLGGEPESSRARRIQDEVKASNRVQGLFSERDGGHYEGKLPYHAYKKWSGAHWVLALLADLGYPPGDRSLNPLFEQVYGWLLSEEHDKRFLVLDGRMRRCASQEGNALFASLMLGYVNEGTHELARRLCAWQWPDGGWNCDKHPEAHHSSFHESLIPLRALVRYSKQTGSQEARAAAERAAEFFLRHELYKREQDGTVINPHFVSLVYPSYWHYDILYGLKVMQEAGKLGDPRCSAALDLLRKKRLADGGFPAEEKYYRLIHPDQNGHSPVGWGRTGKWVMNEFVTVEALSVLSKAKPSGGISYE